MRSRSVIAVLSFALVPFVPPALGGLAGQARVPDTRPSIAGMLVSVQSANPAARVVEREENQKLLEEQNLGASGRVDPQTAAKVGKLVGARYVVLGTFIDFYGDFRVDARLVNV